MELLTLAQTLAATGLGRRTLFRYRENGKFPAALRIGAHNVMFRADEVERWTKQHRSTVRMHRDP